MVEKSHCRWCGRCGVTNGDCAFRSAEDRDAGRVATKLAGLDKVRWNFLVFGFAATDVCIRRFLVLDQRRWREKSMAWEWRERSENHSGDGAEICRLRRSRVLLLRRTDLQFDRLQSKKILKRIQNKDLETETTILERFIGGAIAGFVSQTVVYPLDVSG